MEEIKIAKNEIKTPMYHIENQEKLYFLSKIDELNQTIERLQESHLYAEVQHYKELFISNLHQLEHLNEELEINRVSEEELIKDRNRFKEWKEKLENQVNDLHHQQHIKENILIEKTEKIHELEQKLVQTEVERKNLDLSMSRLDKERDSLLQQLHEKENLLQDKSITINELEKKLLQSENELNTLSLSLSKLEESHTKSSTENETLLKENQTLLQRNQSLNTKVLSQQQHISDLNAALAHSEETKKEMFYSLISKTEELEKLMSERKHALDSLQFAKDQLVEAEKQKMEYIKTFISEYQKQFEENEWWFSTQFADIDQRSKQQDERIEAVEQEQELNFIHQNEVLMEKFEEVEQRFIEFIEEVDSIRDQNSRMTHNLFELKRMVENQKRSQTHIIKPRQKPIADKMVTQNDDSSSE
jgi:chromosome segregation ATPase